MASYSIIVNITAITDVILANQGQLPHILLYYFSMLSQISLSLSLLLLFSLTHTYC